MKTIISILILITFVLLIIIQYIYPNEVIEVKVRESIQRLCDCEEWKKEIKFKKQ